MGSLDYKEDNKLGSLDYKENNKLGSLDYKENNKLGSLDYKEDNKLGSLDYKENNKLSRTRGITNSLRAWVARFPVTSVNVYTGEHAHSDCQSRAVAFS